MASTTQGVIAFQLCQHENKASYQALLSRIPAPVVVVTDGAQGALEAIKECWPTTIIQRCLVHIQRNIRRITTLNPKTDQHKALRQLGLDLTRIHTIDEAITWHKTQYASNAHFSTAENAPNSTAADTMEITHPISSPMGYFSTVTDTPGLPQLKGIRGTMDIRKHGQRLNHVDLILRPLQIGVIKKSRLSLGDLCNSVSVL
ncbi:transposase [Trueperella pyogenes]|uniref:transposase n=1 Tax=Trueperella pyogenes TaxID=1661 RepID=UPI002279CBAC|nr:transposase [Trueperella pyogenes]WHU62118.1 transposase [Trueperella pyogenes]